MSSFQWKCRVKIDKTRQRSKKVVERETEKDQKIAEKVCDRNRREICIRQDQKNKQTPPSRKFLKDIAELSCIALQFSLFYLEL